MKKIISAIVLVVVITLCVSLFTQNTEPVVSAASNPKETSVSDGARNARFLNMLNHNFVYNEDFNSADQMANLSVLALLSNREGDFVAEGHVKGFLKDMYGVEVVDFGNLNENFPEKEGYIYIIPKGYSTYNHKILSVKENEDGSHTVTTAVTVTSHDGQVQTCNAVSLFVKNENSAFGYNIIYSNIIYDMANI